MADFDIQIQPNTGSWGPSTGQVPEKFANMPYQPFKKEDKIGKVSDWTGMTYGVIGGERRTRMYQSSIAVGGVNLYGPTVGEMNDSDFKMVDNNKQQGRPIFRQARRGQFGGQGRGGYQNQNNRYNQNNQANQNQRGGQYNNQRGNQNQRGQRGKRGNWNNKYNNRWYNNKNINREASVKIEADWDKVETLEFTSLQKNITKHVSQPKDLLNCGSLKKYNKAADRVTLRKSTKLRPEVAQKTEFHVVTTTEDPGLKEVVRDHMAKVKSGKFGGTTVMATDTIISALMCCPRSVLPWDIKVYKYGSTIMMDIDDRENFMSPIDFLSVSETAQEPLPEEGVDEINKPAKRSEEATFINQIISQQVLHNSSAQHPPVAGQKPYPFECAKSMVPPSRMYRYREFDLGSDKEQKTKIFVRTEVDGYEPGSSASKPKYVTIKALNEWDSRYCNGINWRSTLEKQTSAVLATEMKNNSFKVARWIMQSRLAGAESIKLAFVTRENAKDDKSHVLVNMESYTPNELATQAGLNPDNCWGILKSIIEVLKNQKKDGAYYIVRNPNEKELNFYRVPEEDEEETEESEEEDDDSEESGSEESGSDDSDESEDDDDDDSDEEED